MASREPDGKVKKPLRRKLLVVLGAYLVCWGATYMIGSIQAETWVKGRMSPIIRTSPRLDGVDLQVMDTRGPGALPKPPWYFIGNPGSPCPFLISHELACRLGDKESGSTGYAEKAYYFWFFGYLHPIGTTPYWTLN